jgi:hypothetical protein
MDNKPSRPRVLLDANVWNYLADELSARELRRESRNVDIIVAPSVFYEALRIQEPETRARRAALITDPSWKKLMRKRTRNRKNFWGRYAAVEPSGCKSAETGRWHNVYDNDWAALSRVSGIGQETIPIPKLEPSGVSVITIFKLHVSSPMRSANICGTSNGILTRRSVNWPPKPLRLV